MACEVYERLQSEAKSARDAWAYFAYKENAPIHGCNPSKAKRLAKEEQPRMNEATNALLLHGRTCEVCKADRESIAKKGN